MFPGLKGPETLEDVYSAFEKITQERGIKVERPESPEGPRTELAGEILKRVEMEKGGKKPTKADVPTVGKHEGAAGQYINLLQANYPQDVKILEDAALALEMWFQATETLKSSEAWKPEAEKDKKVTKAVETLEKILQAYYGKLSKKATEPELKAHLTGIAQGRHRE